MYRIMSKNGRTNIQKSGDVIRPGTDSTTRIEDDDDMGARSRVPWLVECVSGFPVSNSTVSMDGMMDSALPVFGTVDKPPICDLDSLFEEDEAPLRFSTFEAWLD